MIAGAVGGLPGASDDCGGAATRRIAVTYRRSRIAIVNCRSRAGCAWVSRTVLVHRLVRRTSENRRGCVQYGDRLNETGGIAATVAGDPRAGDRVVAGIPWST